MHYSIDAPSERPHASDRPVPSRHRVACKSIHATLHYDKVWLERILDLLDHRPHSRKRPARSTFLKWERQRKRVERGVSWIWQRRKGRHGKETWSGVMKRERLKCSMYMSASEPASCEVKARLPEPGTPQSNWDYEKHERQHLKNAGPSRGTSHATSCVAALRKTAKVEYVSEQGWRGHNQPRSKTQKHRTFVRGV